MDLKLKNKIAVVMASSRGLGRAIAGLLAEEGCDLAMCSRDLESIEKAAQEIRKATGRNVLACVCDVTSKLDIETFAKKVKAEYGSVDILVNNAGGPVTGTFDTLEEEQFLKAAELLLFSVVRVTKALLPLIRASKETQKEGSRIVNLTSVAVREPIVNLMLSNSLRAAVTAWSKTLARELAPEKITVNCVAPGMIHTERIEALIEASKKLSGKNTEEVKAEMLSKIPMNRFGLPEEFAAAVAFLASEKANYITGTTLFVDGGMIQSL
jgi:3-oxoacyl-[acyl-carrier protein] reductase